MMKRKYSKNSKSPIKFHLFPRRGIQKNKEKSLRKTPFSKQKINKLKKNVITPKIKANSFTTLKDTFKV